MLTTDILQEIAAQNMGRNYPLNPINPVLPFPVLVAADINIPYRMLSMNRELRYTLFIRQVTITTNDITVIISALSNETGTETDVAKAYASYDVLRLSREVAIAPLEVTNQDLLGISGFLYFGDVDLFIGYANQWNLDVNSGAFALDCIHPFPDGFTGFIVNGSKITGDIVLEAGDGITITAEGNHIKIKSNVDISSSLITSREELVTAIANKFGNPIVTINDIYSNPATQDFTISAAEGSCSMVSPNANGIILSNPCATTCCDKTSLSVIIDNINELNSRAARLTDYLNSVSSNVNSINNELSILKLSITQQ